MQCIYCSATGKHPTRLPRGWKRSHDNQPICVKCWGERYILRAVTIPVVGPINGTWKELRDDLHDAWADVTALSNWLATECYVRDVRREGQVKLPPQPQTYLYPEARVRFPSIPSASIAAIHHTISRKYRAARYKLIWTGKASLPTYRYPAPMVIPARAWRPEYGKDGVPLVHVTLRRNTKRWTLRLRGGREYRRQLAAFSQMVARAAMVGELALYRQRANAAAHRSGVAGRDSGGQKAYYRVICKMVAWLPREPTSKGEGVLFARTDKDSLLIALNAKEEKLWVLNSDHVRRWEAEYRRKLERWSNDQKAENRPPKFQSRREADSMKYRRRIHSACHEAAVQLVNYAARRRFGVIRYNDGTRDFVGQFPWDLLRGLVREKADAKGITFELVDASGAVAEDGPAPVTATQDRL
jgi:hypothetical protein